MGLNEGEWILVRSEIQDMTIKKIVKSLAPSGLWSAIRRYRIVRSHRKVVKLCDDLLEDCRLNKRSFNFDAKHHFETEKIIWQYWSQGYEALPGVVDECLKSVERFCGDYTIVRLDDENLSEYLDFPEWFCEKRKLMSHAHFSDILRVVLLSTYGGIWVDATIKLTAQIPQEIAQMPFFVFRRDDQEPNKKYWENTYAYYFGWHKDFKVRMLNSFIVARKGVADLSTFKDYLLAWWERHDSLPDYFFFQILYQVMVEKGFCGLDCRVISDTLPHYMQQSINDNSFQLASSEEIPTLSSIHKLTYKKEC